MRRDDCTRSPRMGGGESRTRVSRPLFSGPSEVILITHTRVANQGRNSFSPFASPNNHAALDITLRHDNGNPPPLHCSLALRYLFRAMNSSKFVTSKDGTKIWTDAVGDPSKPSVVFIPGASSTALVFDRQFEDPELAKNLHLVRHLLSIRERLLMPA